MLSSSTTNRSISRSQPLQPPPKPQRRADLPSWCAKRDRWMKHYNSIPKLRALPSPPPILNTMAWNTWKKKNDHNTTTTDVHTQLMMNMMDHHRYEYQERKYTQKDVTLLQIGWESLCREEGLETTNYSVIPFKNATSSSSSSIQQQKYPNKIGHRAQTQYSSDWKCRILRALLRSNVFFQATRHEDIAILNELFRMYPMEEKEEKGHHNNSEDTVVLPQGHHTTSLYASMILQSKYPRACAAGLRLYASYYNNSTERQRSSSSRTEKIVARHFSSSLIPNLIGQSVQKQIIQNKKHSNSSRIRVHRPLYSVKKLKQLEDELGIGMYSKHQYKCGNCGNPDGHHNTILKKCNGCRRVWYCSNSNCQKKSWSTHKHLCGTQWRKQKLYVELSGPVGPFGQAMSMKAAALNISQVVSDDDVDVKDSKDDPMLSAQHVHIDLATHDLFVFCYDPIKDEVFDGLTDRTINFCRPTSTDTVATIIGNAAMFITGGMHK